MYTDKVTDKITRPLDTVHRDVLFRVQCSGSGTMTLIAGGSGGTTSHRSTGEAPPLEARRVAATHTASQLDETVRATAMLTTPCGGYLTMDR